MGSGPGSRSPGGLPGAGLGALSGVHQSQYRRIVRRARRKHSPPGRLLSDDGAPPPRPGGARGGGGGRLRAAEEGDFPFQIYFTSGTTGTPKRVELTHHQIVSHAMGVCRESRLRGGDCWGHFAPIFHLVDAFAMFALTRVGGRHVFLPRFDALSCFRAVEREGVTCSNVASTMLTLMVNSPASAFFDLSTLRLLSCGGSHQSPAVVRKAFSLLGCEFFISYGMTECCGKLTMSTVEAPPAEFALVPVEHREAFADDLADVPAVGHDVAPVPLTHDAHLHPDVGPARGAHASELLGLRQGGPGRGQDGHRQLPAALGHAVRNEELAPQDGGARRESGGRGR